MKKSQIQGLDRTQPGLPIKKGRAGTMTHDYKRHGTTTLFAALDILDGKVIGQCARRHRHRDFIRFLNALDARIPRRKAVHVVLDNYATHKHPAVLAWLAQHPRFTFHFTPTSCSWLNAIETFFAKLTKRRLKRGVFRSVAELKAAIHRFIAENNNDPKPFVWTAQPHRIIAAVQRGLQKLESIHYVLRGGVAWRLLPSDFPPRQTVYRRVASWRDACLCERINQARWRWPIANGSGTTPTPRRRPSTAKA